MSQFTYENGTSNTTDSPDVDASNPLDADPSNDPDVQEVHPSNVPQPKKKRPSIREANWSADEDKLLCSAFLNVSKDAIIGEFKCIHHT